MGKGLLGRAGGEASFPCRGASKSHGPRCTAPHQVFLLVWGISSFFIKLIQNKWNCELGARIILLKIPLLFLGIVFSGSAPELEYILGPEGLPAKV